MFSESKISARLQLSNGQKQCFVIVLCVLGTPQNRQRTSGWTQSSFLDPFDKHVQYVLKVNLFYNFTAFLIASTWLEVETLFWRTLLVDIILVINSAVKFVLSVLLIVVFFNVYNFQFFSKPRQQNEDALLFLVNTVISKKEIGLHLFARQ